MCEGVSPASWMMNSPRSVSTTSQPSASSTSLRWISSLAIDLPLATSGVPVPADELPDDGGGFGAVGGPVDVTAEGLEARRPLVERRRAVPPSRRPAACGRPCAAHRGSASPSSASPRLPAISVVALRTAARRRSSRMSRSARERNETGAVVHCGHGRSTSARWRNTMGSDTPPGPTLEVDEAGQVAPDHRGRRRPPTTRRACRPPSPRRRPGASRRTSRRTRSSARPLRSR